MYYLEVRNGLNLQYKGKGGNIMGRLRKYMTEEEQRAARKKRQKEYYGKNRERINGKNLDRYYKNRG